MYCITYTYTYDMAQTLISGHTLACGGGRFPNNCNLLLELYIREAASRMTLQQPPQPAVCFITKDLTVTVLLGMYLCMVHMLYIFLYLIHILSSCLYFWMFLLASYWSFGRNVNAFVAFNRWDHWNHAEDSACAWMPPEPDSGQSCTRYSISAYSVFSYFDIITFTALVKC